MVKMQLNNNLSTEDLSFSQHRVHTPQLCACTLSFLRRGQVCLFTTLPTQNKDVADTMQQEDYDCHVITLGSDSHQVFPKVPSPKYCVPFDYADNTLLWLEYKDKKRKSLQYFNLASQQVLFEKEFPSSTYSVSFGRLCLGHILYVANFSQVTLVDPGTNTTTVLYSHEHNITALGCSVHDHPVMSKGEDSRMVNDLAALSLVTIDAECNIKVY